MIHNVDKKEEAEEEEERIQTPRTMGTQKIWTKRKKNPNPKKNGKTNGSLAHIGGPS
jgi:hypothetical protein